MEASTLSFDEAESERSDFFIELDEELQIATKAVVQSQQQIEEMKQQLDDFKNLSSELEGKNNHISSLELELTQFKDFQAVTSKATFDAIYALNKLRLEMEIKDEQLRTELEIADVLTQQLEIGKIEKQELKDEMSKGGERVLMMEVEIATLKSEIHKERSRVVAAEAATARVMSSREGLYLAVKEFAIEAMKAKAEVRMLKELQAESVSHNVINAPMEDNELKLLKQKLGAANSEIDELRLSLKEAESAKVEATLLVELKIASESDIVNDVKLLNEKLRAANVEIDKLTVNLKEAQILNELKVSSDIENVMLDAPPQDNGIELLKEKLETANVEIDELRVSLEEMVERAKKAERDKDEMKEYLRRSRQKRAQRMSVSEEHKKQSVSARFEEPPVIRYSPKRAASMNIQGIPGYNLGDYEKHPRSHSYVPLYRYLNIKLGRV